MKVPLPDNFLNHIGKISLIKIRVKKKLFIPFKVQGIRMFSITLKLTLN